jgi:AcrR family transcriptional regulator
VACAAPVLILRHFRGKDALFLALLEEHYDHDAIERERDHAGKLELLVSEVP